MLNNGEGKQATATTDTALWTLPNAGANGISVFITYTETAQNVFALVNCSIAEFDALYDAGRAIKVFVGVPYNFNGDGQKSVSSICYRTASGSSDISFAAF
jgi:hypothetical protein